MTTAPNRLPRADIGVYGLGVMGTSLARNLAHHGHEVALFNYTPDLTERFVNDYSHEGLFHPARDIEGFTASLKTPRVVLVMVPAGAATESVVNQLRSVLSPGDIIIDGGNAFYPDTIRREKALRTEGIHFVGMGVSGGEEGALEGPSLMPGGADESYTRIGPLLEDIAAQVDGRPCCAHVGPDGAGHFVKMVHNGIEYADMQVIAEAYDLLRRIGGLSIDEIAEVFRSWRRTELDSYLIDITAEVLDQVDSRTGRPLIDVIVDQAGQKGTGVWSSQTALDHGVPVPAIAEATFARSASSAIAQRTALRNADITPGTAERTPANRAAFVESVRMALYGAKIAAYAQGFHEIATASELNGWNINLAQIARIWRGGCIIRARFLDDIASAYEDELALPSLLTAPVFASALEKALPAWRRLAADAILAGVPAPVFASGLAYIDSLRSERLPAALIQGQRDFFGAHGYRRIDDPGTTHHVLWAEERRPEVRQK